MDSAVIYDAANANQPLLSSWMWIIAIIVVVIGVATSLKPQLARKGDATVIRGVAILVTIAAASVIAFSLIRWMHGAASSHAEAVVTVQGCVKNFRREVDPNAHNLADTYFDLGGSSFHFNSSPWVSGFHNEADVIKPGDGLRISKSGGTVIQIVHAPEACRAS